MTVEAIHLKELNNKDKTMNTEQLEQEYQTSTHKIKWGTGGLQSVKSFYQGVNANGANLSYTENMISSDITPEDQLELKAILDRGRLVMQERIKVTDEEN